MPSFYASASAKATYRNNVEEEVQRYLTEQIGTHYFGSKEGLSLNITVNEAELLMGSRKAFKKTSESGKLKEIHEKIEEYEAKLDKELGVNLEHLNTMMEQINAHENATYDGLVAHGIIGFKKHGETGLFDLLGFSGGDHSANNLT